MTKSNLRELFGRFNDPVSCYSVWVHDLLEALVEAVEPEVQPEPDIEMLRIQYDREELVRELTEAKAETEKWRLQHGAVQVLRIDERAAGMQLGSQLAEAKAEIEKLRGWQEWWGEQLRLNPLDGRAPDIETHFAQLKADAEIGRLVKGMRRGSQLRHPGLLEGWVGLDFATRQRADDPAEALRAIQQVKEHKCE